LAESAVEYRLESLCLPFMEHPQEKRQREDDYIEEPLSKKSCNLKEVDAYKIPVNGKRSSEFGTYALCSAEDYDNLSKHSWCWSNKGYPISTLTLKENRSVICMSRFIMKPKKGDIVDHINRDRKDNRRENLRIVTHSQNAQNRTKRDGSSSSYKGVYYVKSYKKFRVKLLIKGVNHNIGLFDNEIDAARAYDKYITQNREKLGLCHELNFPGDVDIYKGSPPILLKSKPVTKFRYVTVHKKNNKFEVRLRNGKQMIYLGAYITAEEAAKTADHYIVQNNLNKKLNFPEDYPNFNSQKVKFHITEIDLSDSKIRNILKNIGEHSELADVDPNRDVLIKLGGKIKDKYTIIERDDYESVKYFTISASGPICYVKLSKGSTNHWLSRFLFRDTVRKDEVVDHIFSNTLDNRRRFLKVVSFSQNNKNRRKSIGKSSKFSGVSRSENRYFVYITNNGKSMLRKNMRDENEAARLRYLFIIHNCPDDNYRMNFKDWDEETKKYWTDRLKEYIHWKTLI
jgi:hypothetical protein